MNYLFINASEDSGVDTIRTTIRNFASSYSISKSQKVIVLDECLHEDERVRIGTVDDWVPVSLNELKRNTQYNIVSFNMNSNEYENDTGEIISDKEDEVYEVELECGRTVRCTANHPFIVNLNNKAEELSISSGLEIGSEVVIMA